MTRRRLYLGAAAVLVAAMAWSFLDFRRAVESRPQAAPTLVAAIVVLTGGPARVRAGLDLLAAGASERLYISGAGEKVTADAILAANPDVTVQQADRIEIGHAKDTAGNAAETAAWAARNDVQGILLVTAAYHMPRSLLLFRQTAPELTIYPQPVAASAGALTMVGEWMKLLATRLGLG